jgi:type IV pilus assembly protein PilQ
MIAEASGFNIILSSEVKGLQPLTLNLTNTPWDQALDTILSLNKLVAKKNGNILMVQSYVTAAKDREEELKAKQAAKSREILVTKIFPISYADTQELIAILKEYLTKDRGRISEDKRTNSLIIKDTPIVMDKLKKIVETLDLQTPQVLIEAKVVEVSEGHSKSIGLENGLSFGYDPIGAIGDRVPTTVGETVSSDTDGGPGFAFSTAPSSDGDAAGTAFGLTVTRFGRLTNLNFNLQLLETESKGKVLSSPKVITQNRKKAELTATNTDSYQVTSGTGTEATTSFEEVQASLKLGVTPQVTNEGSIILEIELTKEDFGRRTFATGPPTKTGNAVTTTVLVENGSTIVLGGLYEYRNEEAHSGIPFLKDIPLIGWLFRTPYNPSVSKREVIIFLTPRIINQEEAGLVNKG